ncbi:hypothetical protein LJ655_12360 [Paraburkholderia sp. MMS20-SJTN17]|uniref:Transmembrane protein n=1 Tax=Paraburkholderia translucens TaxID=2886945 RepID=A0ABS8KD80_9BURK|nr:hypothetical protein [Paraburkholderia sp. MMS20-SJTN17]MCC8402673.1 hypothetical protein [Paraburkholderia sp. MMS20-SJTN17]
MQSPVSSQGRLSRAEKRRLWIFAGAGFFVSPGAWLLQVIVSEAVSAQTCDATTTPLPSPGVSHMHLWLYGTSAVAFLISAACAALAAYGFVLLDAREQRIKDRQENGGPPRQPPRDQEEIGRKRFIAMCSAMIGCGFAVGLIFTVLAEIFLVSCSRWH